MCLNTVALNDYFLAASCFTHCRCVTWTKMNFKMKLRGHKNTNVNICCHTHFSTLNLAKQASPSILRQEIRHLDSGASIRRSESNQAWLSHSLAGWPIVIQQRKSSPWALHREKNWGLVPLAFLAWSSFVDIGWELRF